MLPYYREGMRVQTLWNLLEVVLPVTAEAVADVTRAHAHPQPSQGAHNVLHFGGYESISSDLPVGHRTRSRMLTLVYGQDSAVGTWGERTPHMSTVRLGILVTPWAALPRTCRQRVVPRSLRTAVSPRRGQAYGP